MMRTLRSTETLNGTSGTFAGGAANAWTSTSSKLSDVEDSIYTSLAILLRRPDSAPRDSDRFRGLSAFYGAR
jgi:hypothetical protein